MRLFLILLSKPRLLQIPYGSLSVLEYREQQKHTHLIVFSSSRYEPFNSAIKETRTEVCKSKLRTSASTTVTDSFFQKPSDDTTVRAWLSGMQMDMVAADSALGAHRPNESSTPSAHRPAAEFLYLDAPFRSFTCSTCDTGCCKEEKDEAFDGPRSKAGTPRQPLQGPPVISTYRSTINTAGRLGVSKIHPAASTAVYHRSPHQPSEPRIPAPTLLPVQTCEEGLPSPNSAQLRPFLPAHPRTVTRAQA